MKKIFPQKAFKLGLFAIVISLAISFIIVLLGFLLSTYSFYVVLTDSMSPDIPRGSLVIARRTRYVDFGLGDVIVYVNPIAKGKYFMHRVVRLELEKGFVQVMGQASHVRENVPLYYVRGVVVFSTPYIGLIFYYANKHRKIVVLTLLLVTLAILLYPELAKRVRKHAK